MSSYISGLESRASSRGMNKVKANRAVDVNVMGQNVQQQDYSRPMVDQTVQQNLIKINKFIQNHQNQECRSIQCSLVDIIACLSHPLIGGSIYHSCS